MQVGLCYESVLPARGGCEHYISDLAHRLARWPRRASFRLPVGRDCTALFDNLPSATDADGAEIPTALAIRIGLYRCVAG